MEAQANCPDVSYPDTISFSFCGNGIDVNTGEIDFLLRNKYRYNLDSLRTRDSLTWIDVKQDSIYMLARRHGVNRSQVEGLIDFNDVVASADTIKDLAGCAGPGNLDAFGDSIESVLHAPVDLSNVYLLFNEEALSTVYKPTDNTAEKISLLEDKTYKFTKKGTYYIQFYSPWNGGKCLKTVPLVIEDFTPDVPKVFYAGTEITPDTTIYVCKEADIENIKIEKIFFLVFFVLSKKNVNFASY